MPELPEVENFKRYIDATSLHQDIDSTEVNNKQVLKNISVQAFSIRLTGHSFESTYRHGKYLFVRTDHSDELVLHFGMTGHPVYYKQDDRAPDYPRVIFHFSNGTHLAFDCMRMLGEVRLIENRDKFIKEKELGSDALRDVDDVEIFTELLDQKRGYIKSALMDQSLMAGIGNECSDEILFQSRIHPKTNVQDLNTEQLKTLYSKIREVLQVKIDANLKPENLPDTYILKNRSEGAACPNCDGEIERIKVSGRSGYYCPKCQQRKT